MIDKSIKLDFNDILIEPNPTTTIKSRSEINIHDAVGNLPIFTAPMDTVVDGNNLNLFKSLNINVCLPRGEGGYPDDFKSFSLDKFKNTFFNGIVKGNIGNVLIDTANGHLDEIVEAVKDFKRLSPKQIIMVGNVANAEAYVKLSNAGADYIRVGIGNGGGCLTTQQTGVGFPMASLISECYDKSCELDNPAKIVADGGMQKYSDIIKALALGADYVMLGSIFNKALESSGKNYIFKSIPVSQVMAEILHTKGFEIHKQFRGMSTKEVQKKWGNKVLKTSEGVVRYRPVEYTLESWIENFESYLRSAMSYSNARDLKEFVNNSRIIRVSEHSYKRYNK